MEKRKVGPFTVGAIGLGCMNFSHAYGKPPARQEAVAVLRQAVERGVDFFDTAALYGFGANETLVGEALKPYRQKIVLASKCGMGPVDGKRVIDGHPATIKATCEAALRRLRTDVIDLYYLHRRDFQVPIEDSVGALADLVAEGKIRTIGLSEVSAATLRRAQAVHPVAAVQSEYSLWTREAEIAMLDACRETGTAFVAFSPLGRGFLCGELSDPATQLASGDLRLSMPRFAPDNYAHNLRLLDGMRVIAGELGCSMAQLALAWVLARQPHTLVIPGTRSAVHLADNLGAARVTLTADVIARLDALINHATVAGPRYNAATLAEIDTEAFGA